MPPSPNSSWIAVTDIPGATPGSARIIELRRPEKLNCLSLSMLDGLLFAVRESRADCLVLTGEGRAFCTGLDLKEVAGPGAGRAHLQRLIALYHWFLRTEIPTVALARGYAVGGGAGLLACARTAIVSSDFRFRLPAGDLSRLASVVVPLCHLRAGGKRPPQTGWLGCDLEAPQAHQLGLVNQVVSPERLDELLQLARSGVIGPELLQGAKRDRDAVSRADFELERH